MAKLGCGCGVIEPSLSDMRTGYHWSNRAAKAREEAARILENAERWEEISKRFLGGGKDCERCEGAGGWQCLPDPESGLMGVSGWEVCSDCEGFGVTRALTCYDHSEHAKGMKLREIRAAMPRMRGEPWVSKRWAATQVW